jgi:hypothetical protein
VDTAKSTATKFLSVYLWECLALCWACTDACGSRNLQVLGEVNTESFQILIFLGSAHTMLNTAAHTFT